MIIRNKNPYCDPNKSSADPTIGNLVPSYTEIISPEEYGTISFTIEPSGAIEAGAQ